MVLAAGTLSPLANLRKCLKESTKNRAFYVFPFRASFVTQSFTQGVAIGLDMFKPFQAISRGYLKLVRSTIMYHV